MSVATPFASGASYAQTARRVLADLAARGARIERLTADSRAVRPGDCFVAYPGANADGRRFVGNAIAAGAGAVLWEKSKSTDRETFAWRKEWAVPHVAVAGLRPLVGEIASQVYGEPSHRLHVIGVTGTNGKTSTTQWIAQALAHAGKRSAVIGTLGIGAIEPPGPTAFTENPNTTPDAIVLQESLARFAGEGVDAVAMEVSSIGLDQGRVNGTRFECAVFTNLSRDHLDYHGTMEAYARAKMRLFDWTSLTHAVVNLDDVIGVRIAQQLRGRMVRRIGYSATGTAALIDVDELLVARDVRYAAGGLAFTIVGSVGAMEVRTPFVGAFNVANLLAVAAVLVAQGIEFAAVRELIDTLAPVPGRMQRVLGAQDAKSLADSPVVLVDYAHTPDALEKALVACRELASARGGALVALFGCGGDRDRGKRPEMGRIAARLADRVVLTSDNPRSESPADILAQIDAGVRAANVTARVIEDRRAAIEAAISDAGAADVVLVAGKGHEPYQEIAGVRHPFLDAEVAAQALRGRSR